MLAVLVQLQSLLDLANVLERVRGDALANRALHFDQIVL